MCTTLDILKNTTFKNLYFQQPQLNEHDLITYNVAEISTDVHAYQMIIGKSQFPFNITIELYVEFRRSTKQILSILNPLTTFSINPNHITSMQAIIYIE